jgi:Flp pilus assembly protein TadG
MNIAKISAQQASIIQRFHRANGGNVAMLFGMSVTALIAITGGAVDFARFYQAKTKAQTALDAATLAGGRAVQLAADSNTTGPIAAAQAYYNRMRPDGAANATPVFSVIDGATAFRGTLTYLMPNYFLSIVGIPSTSATLVSEAAIAAGGNAGTNLELSLMLDTTGSMAGQKIEDLKLAAKDLVDIVVWDDQSQYTSKIALAPFSARVNVGDYLQSVSDVQQTRSFGGGNQLKGITCVTERTGVEAFTDEKPVGQNTLSAYKGDTGNTAKTNAHNYSASGDCAVPAIMPLTSNKTALKDRIDELPAANSTAGSLGTAWAWYLLSPRWTGIWQGENLPAPYGDLTQYTALGNRKLSKVAVLMTDGVFNTTGGQNYGDGSPQAVTISGNTVAICNNMKAAGIKVYTVGFQLGGDQLAIDTLKACASRDASDPADQPSFFYSVESGSELRGAFRQIALQLSTLRIRR